MAGAAVPQPFWMPVCELSSYPLDLIGSAASLHFGQLLRHCVSYRLRSLVKKFAPLDPVIGLKDLWCERAFQLKGISLLQLSDDDLSSLFSTSFSVFNGGEHKTDLGNNQMSDPKMSWRNPVNGRKWTNILLAANTLLIILSSVCMEFKFCNLHRKTSFYYGELSLIDKGQLWRLATSSFLHANIGHFLVNYSFNLIGPTVESFSGSTRYLAVYFVFTIASTAMSYWFSPAPAVGASGAIFGLVGSVALFVFRHGGLVGGGKEDLQHIAQVIVLNIVRAVISCVTEKSSGYYLKALAIGDLQVGGLIGGAAASWLIGTAWKHESTLRDGRRIFADRAPMYNLFNIKGVPKQLK